MIQFEYVEIRQRIKSLYPPEKMRMSIGLLALSLTVLFQEMSLIRWVPGQVRVLAYFPNLILLAAFLGLGLGCLCCGKRSLLLFWPISLLVMAGAAYGLGQIIFTQNSPEEYLWLLYYDLPKDSLVINDVKLPIVICFILAMVTFLAPGQLIAERLRYFRDQARPLFGYRLDLIGSLFGVMFFGVLSFSGTRPIIWFTILAIMGALFFITSWKKVLIFGATMTAMLFIVFVSERSYFYSPYYAIKVILNLEKGYNNVAILTNGSLHQVALSLNRKTLPENEKHRDIFKGYHDPYRLLKVPPHKVLVLGAGTGNDVAVALSEGAEHIDAVEIDPIILKMGKRFHPDQPYNSPKVRLINTDARSFLNQTEETYDLIVFGTLDSMTRLSALSNVRLDNYVYTQESIEAAKRHLTPDGGLVMYFMNSEDFIFQRLASLCTKVFGIAPAINFDYHHLFNTIYLNGPAFDGIKADQRKEATNLFLDNVNTPPISTDDWPFLYLKFPEISSFYWSLIFILALLAAVSVYFVSPQTFTRGGWRKRENFEMLLFGMGFLLLETRAVTEMNLVWGATWLTSTVVFASILFMVLLSTFGTSKVMGWRTSISGFLVLLAISYVVPTQTFLVGNIFLKLFLSCLMVGLPVFFASRCFSLLFSAHRESDQAFGWNLLGAVLGGLLEYLSMVVGIKGLSLVVAVIYLTALLVKISREKKHLQV